MKLYLNGELAGQNSYSGDLNNYNSELVAASAWGVTFAGAIDELRIWNIALDSSAIEIRSCDIGDIQHPRRGSHNAGLGKSNCRETQI